MHVDGLVSVHPFSMHISSTQVFLARTDCTANSRITQELKGRWCLILWVALASVSTWTTNLLSSTSDCWKSNFIVVYLASLCG